MLDGDYRSATALPPPATRPIEFCTIQLSPLLDGRFAVAVKHTLFDETEFELTDQDMVYARAVTLDEVIVLVTDSLRTAFSLPPLPRVS